VVGRANGTRGSNRRSQRLFARLIRGKRLWGRRYVDHQRRHYRPLTPAQERAAVMIAVSLDDSR
jgi:hypothetical protein